MDRVDELQTADEGYETATGRALFRLHARVEHTERSVTLRMRREHHGVDVGDPALAVAVGAGRPHRRSRRRIVSSVPTVGTGSVVGASCMVHERAAARGGGEPGRSGGGSGCRT